MSTWTWHRGDEVAETDGLTPPPGEGWTLVPGQGPGLGEVPGIESRTPGRQAHAGGLDRRPKEYRSFDTV